MDVLESLNIKAEVEYGGKHAKLRFVANGRPTMMVLSLSPSDFRVYQNARRQIKHLLRERGVMIPRGA
jgi:hypothetical protein